MAKTYRVAVIAGDGIGKEVVPEGIRAMEAAARRYGFGFEWQEFGWSCETYAKTGRMMPEDGIAQLTPFDAVYLGAVGYPGVPDHISLWGLLIPLRREFQQYINLRPVRLLAGVDTPLKNRAPCAPAIKRRSKLSVSVKIGRATMAPSWTTARCLTRPNDTPTGHGQVVTTASAPYLAGELTRAAPPRYFTQAFGE